MKNAPSDRLAMLAERERRIPEASQPLVALAGGPSRL
jgi:hypothetical protein